MMIANISSSSGCLIFSKRKFLVLDFKSLSLKSRLTMGITVVIIKYLLSCSIKFNKLYSNFSSTFDVRFSMIIFSLTLIFLR